MAKFFMNNLQPINRADQSFGLLPVAYHPVETGDINYVPEKPFRGLHVGGDGKISITGIDGVDVTLIFYSPGYYPYGGIGIPYNGVEQLVVLF